MVSGGKKFSQVMELSVTINVYYGYSFLLQPLKCRFVLCKKALHLFLFIYVLACMHVLWCMWEIKGHFLESVLPPLPPSPIHMVTAWWYVHLHAEAPYWTEVHMHACLCVCE